MGNHHDVGRALLLEKKKLITITINQCWAGHHGLKKIKNSKNITINQVFY